MNMRMQRSFIESESSNPALRKKNTTRSGIVCVSCPYAPVSLRQLYRALLTEALWNIACHTCFTAIVPALQTAYTDSVCHNFYQPHANTGAVCVDLLLCFFDVSNLAYVSAAKLAKAHVQMPSLLSASVKIQNL